jgi:ATP-dependent Clp protease ATP-binding subunit ClpB
VIIMTSNIGSHYLLDGVTPHGEIKAIDLVDEACARLRTEIDPLPAELDEITRRVTRLEIEEVSLAKESDPASRLPLEELRKELADLRAEADARHAQWGRRTAGIAARNRLPHRFIDLERDKQAERLLERFGVAASDAPVVIWGTGRQSVRDRWPSARSTNTSGGDHLWCGVCGGRQF